MHAASNPIKFPARIFSSSFISLNVRPCLEFIEDRVLLSATVLDPALAQDDSAASAIQVSLPNKIGWDGVVNPTGDSVETGTRYRIFDVWGGAWVDAEKQLPDSSSAPGTGDDFMCWAAAASNVLQWTGWGAVSGITNTDQIFKYFQDHWTDEGNLPTSGYEYWFDGTNPTASYGSGWSRIDVAGGGNFYPTYNYGSYVYSRGQGATAEANAMADIDAYARAGDGIAIGVFGGGGHAITVWGFNYDAALPSTNTAYYKGIWVTDSDDNKNVTDALTAPDVLHYYGVSYSGGRYYLQNFYGTSNVWYIGEVDGLARRGAPPPADDYANAGNWASAAAITLDSGGNGSISGKIEVNADTDLFKFVAAKTGSTTLTLTPSSTLDGVMNIYNSSGTLLKTVDTYSAGGTESTSIALTAGQTYYVCVSSYLSASSGSYALAVKGAANQAPTLTTMKTLTGAKINTPFTITYDMLAAAGNEADPNGDPISFRIESVTSGTLTKNGVAVKPGSTLVAKDESIVWTPRTNASGTISAFTVRAWDGLLASASPVQVKVSVSKSTRFAGTTFLGSSPVDVPALLRYDTIADNFGDFNTQGEPVQLRVESLGKGQLFLNGKVAQVDSLIKTGDSVLWIPANDARGIVNAFSVSAFDGQATQEMAIQIQLQAAPVIPWNLRTNLFHELLG